MKDHDNKLAHEIISGLGEKLDRYRLVVLAYIEARIARTECMQKKFKQLCNACKEYGTCKIYRNHCDKWMELQNLTKEN